MSLDGDQADVRMGLILLVASLLIIGLSTFGLVMKYNDEPEVPEDSMQFVSGTEYAPGQEGQVALLVTNSVGNIVTSDYVCNYTVLYPAKATFISGNFSNVTTSVGTYFVKFTVPSTEGVYEYMSTCVKPGQMFSAGKSFHVTAKRLQAVMPK